MSAALPASWQPTEEQRSLALRIARSYARRVPANVSVQALEQAALVGLWRGLQRAEPDHPGTLWYLAMFARNAVRDELRTHAWLKRKMLRSGQVRVLYGDDAGEFQGRRFEDQLPSRGESPEDQAELQQRVEQLRGAIEQLPERERRVMRLVAAGYTQKAIAGELGVSEPRISQRYQRAIRRLRAHLEGEASDDRRTDGGAGGAAPQGPAERAVERSLPRGGLGGSPAPHAHRAVPGGAGSAAVEGAPPERLLGTGAQVHPSRSAASGGDRVLAVSEQPVPSVLPEEGINLTRELRRYRQWLVEQALVQTGGNYSAAARLLGLKASWLYRVCPSGGRRKKR